MMMMDELRDVGIHDNLGMELYASCLMQMMVLETKLGTFTSFIEIKMASHCYC